MKKSHKRAVRKEMLKHAEDYDDNMCECGADLESLKHDFTEHCDREMWKNGYWTGLSEAQSLLEDQERVIAELKAKLEKCQYFSSINPPIVQRFDVK